MSVPGVELVMPAIAIGTVIATGGMTYAAVRRLEHNDEEKDKRLRELERDMATLKERVATWGESE